MDAQNIDKLIKRLEIYQGVREEERVIHDYFYLKSLFSKVVVVDYAAFEHNDIIITCSSKKLKDIKKSNDICFIFLVGIKSFITDESYVFIARAKNSRKELEIE